MNNFEATTAPIKPVAVIARDTVKANLDKAKRATWDAQHLGDFYDLTKDYFDKDEQGLASLADVYALRLKKNRDRLAELQANLKRYEQALNDAEALIIQGALETVNEYETAFYEWREAETLRTSFDTIRDTVENAAKFLQEENRLSRLTSKASRDKAMYARNDAQKMIRRIAASRYLSGAQFLLLQNEVATLAGFGKASN